MLDTKVSLEGFCERSFNVEVSLFRYGSHSDTHYFWTVYVESRAAFCFREPYSNLICLIGNSETWENLSRITDSAVVFYIQVPYSTGPGWEHQMLSLPRCRREGVLMMFSLSLSSLYVKKSGEVTLPEAG